MEGTAFLLSVILIVMSCMWNITPTASGQDNRLNVAATTTLLADLAEQIGGEAVTVQGLMGAGIDPHQYQASAGDVIKLQEADLVVYNGLHLEGKMGDIFGLLEKSGKMVVCVGSALDESDLLYLEGGAVDPHIWFDVFLWKKAAEELAQGLGEAVPEARTVFETNLQNYLYELDALHTYILRRTEEIPPQQRVLVTAHDAFGYFGRRYGFEVQGLQGLSTAAEAGTADVSRLAADIAQRRIPAVFVETSVPPRNIEALQAAVRAKGFTVELGGELYSDSLGGAGSGAETYIRTFRANIDTIADALKKGEKN